MLEGEQTHEEMSKAALTLMKRHSSFERRPKLLQRVSATMGRLSGRLSHSDEPR